MMGLVGVLIASRIMVVMVDVFYLGFWYVGLRAIVGGGYLFSNLGVEYVGGFLWNGGFRCLVVISIWVVGLCFLCTGFIGLSSPKIFGLCIFTIIVMGLIFFIRGNWFVLYFFFECSLIPIIILILGWGYQPERLQAAGYLLMYTVCASLPFLMSLVRGYWEDGVISFLGVGGFSGSWYGMDW